MRMKIIMRGAALFLSVSTIVGCVGCAPKSAETPAATQAAEQVQDVASSPTEAPTSDTPDAEAALPTGTPPNSPTVQEAQLKDEEAKIEWMTAIVEGIYESEIVSILPKNDPMRLGDENVTVYEAICENGRTCLLATDFNGLAYVSEDLEKPNFRVIHIGADQITVGESLLAQTNEEDCAAMALDILKDLSLGVDLKTTHEGQDDLDHREVEVYAVHEKGKESEPIGFIAVDTGLTYGYYRGAAAEAYNRLLLDDGKYINGDTVPGGNKKAS